MFPIPVQSVCYPFPSTATMPKKRQTVSRFTHSTASYFILFLSMFAHAFSRSSCFSPYRIAEAAPFFVCFMRCLNFCFETEYNQQHVLNRRFLNFFLTSEPLLVFQSCLCDKYSWRHSRQSVLVPRGRKQTKQRDRRS